MNAAMSLGDFTPTVRAHVEALCRQPRGKRRVAVFDLDRTCVMPDVGEAILQHLAQCGVLHGAHPTAAYQQYETLLATQGLMVAYPWATQVMAGLSETFVRETSQRVLATMYATGALVIFPAITALMQTFAQAHIEIWIVSASQRWAVEALIDLAQWPVQGAIGMAVEVRDGVLTDQLVQPITCAEGKVQAITQHIGQAPTFVCGDSANDFAMLAMATDMALLIDHGNQALRTHAMQQGWDIQPAWA